MCLCTNDADHTLLCDNCNWRYHLFGLNLPNYQRDCGFVHLAHRVLHDLASDLLSLFGYGLGGIQKNSHALLTYISLHALSICFFGSTSILFFCFSDEYVLVNYWSLTRFDVLWLRHYMTTLRLSQRHIICVHCLSPNKLRDPRWCLILNNIVEDSVKWYKNVITPVCLHSLGK